MEVKRRNFFIDKNFQTKFIIRFCAIVLASSLVMGILLFFLSAGFTTVAIENARVTVKRSSDFILPMIIETIAIVTIFSAVSVIFLTLFTSHKIAGPLYRLKREIDVFKAGDLNAQFHTRKTDQLQDLAKALSGMGSELRARHLELKNKISQLKDCVEKHPEDRNAISNKIREVEQALNYFKC